jgi:hypothetical protein
MSLVEFVQAVPANELPHSYALDRADTGILSKYV